MKSTYTSSVFDLMSLTSRNNKLTVVSARISKDCLVILENPLKMAASDHIHGNSGQFNMAHTIEATPNWNYFRYVADYMHLFGVLTVLATLSKNQNCKGISFRSQVLYLVIFCCRYLDLLHHTHVEPP